MDQLDKDILNLLRDNARLSNAEISRRVGRAPSVIFERLRRLEGSVIRRYYADIDPKAVDRSTLGFLLVRARAGEDIEALGQRLAASPEVLEAHYVAGEDGFLLKVSSRDCDDLLRVVQSVLGDHEGVREVRTLVALRSFKQCAPLPLDGVAVEDCAAVAAESS
ncbi:MAG: Lrp/AsnC family transcriptional regulator [Sumerlaeia bacterium]